ERRYGGGVSVAAGADYIDARVPGMQAAYERTYRAMAIAAFTGQPYFMGGNGTLDEGKVFSPVQYILEREMGEGLWRLGQGIRVNEETLAVDTIAEVGVGEGKSYLATDHTLRHYKETWFPRYLVRGMWESDAVEFSREQRMLDQAFQHYRACVAAHEKPALDAAKLAEIHKIVGKAREHLLG
ncbi:MAG: trimethylamine methyltransferase family protein, partial [Anaerolineae bacterium]|nr:trimethylamine methyltransferase family protein [Anaerolineae bacterium]